MVPICGSLPLILATSSISPVDGNSSVPVQRAATNCSNDNMEFGVLLMAIKGQPSPSWTKQRHENRTSYGIEDTATTLSTGQHFTRIKISSSIEVNASSGLCYRI
jgi:hypothetical protein